MSLESLFTSVNFKNTIQKYCAQTGWKIADLNNERAILRFTMDSGRVQTLYILRYETTLEFSVPSEATFEDEDRIPHWLSTILLRRNAQNKIGFWCIEEIGKKQVYSYMHNAEMSLINQEYFARVILALIRECDNFEGILDKIVNG